MAEMDLLKIINSLPSLIEQLGKALHDLESQEDASIDKGLLEDIEGHFRKLEASVVNKSLELEIREKAFKEQESDAHLLIASREADVAGKEQILWDHLQELKDAAVSAIAEARGDHQLASLEHTDVENNKGFKLTERFPLVALLKGYLRDLRRNAQGKGGNSGNAEELGAVKAVVQCIREYKLEAEYPLEPLLRRVTQLEKAISNDRARSHDKKRQSGSANHQQSKKPRTTGGTHGPRPANVSSRQPPSVYIERVTATNPSRQVPSGYAERTTYAAGLLDKYSYLGTSYDYQAPSQATYPPQAYEQRSYYYPADEGINANSYPPPSSYGNYAGTGLPTADERVNASSYAAPPPSSYGNYAGSGMPTAHQPYM